MKNLGYIQILIAILLTFTMSSCDVIYGIFEAGMWFGIIGLVLIVSLIFWIFGRLRR
jgi:hypothetical protein